MRYIQFVFNEIISPPPGTYNISDEVMAERRISSKLDIRKVKMILKENHKGKTLHCIEIHFSGEEEPLEIKDTKDESNNKHRDSRKRTSRVPSNGTVNEF